MRRPLLSLLALSFALAIAGPAAASDGVLEISRTCAIQTGCFPGDAPGLPVTITMPGAYRLTSNLSQAYNPRFDGVTTAIDITSPGVDLDLGGFAISCFDPEAPSNEPCGGSGHGIATSGGFQAGIRISNGSIFGMPQDGIHLSGGDGSLVESIRSFGNGQDGIMVGGEAVVSDSTSRDNGRHGFWLGQGNTLQRSSASRNGGDGAFAATGSLVTGNTFYANHARGIDARTGTTVSNNTVSSNWGNGIQVGNRVHARGNTITANGGWGLYFAGGVRSGYGDNLIADNASGNVSTNSSLGVSAGGNVCGDTTSCP
ncbi:MAG: right-handed parallel beta-helix repeat-containing protein [Myxococcota bacterium]